MTTSNTGVLHSDNKIRKDILLQKIGGNAVLRQAVDDFYNRLVQDPALQRFFQGANLKVLKWHQFNLMSIAFHDVPPDFDIRKLILTRHTNLFDQGLNEQTYDIVLKHFSDTLRELNVPEETISDASGIVSPLRDIFAEGAVAAQQRRQHAERLQAAIQVGMAVTAVTLLLAWIRHRRH